MNTMFSKEADEKLLSQSTGESSWKAPILHISSTVAQIALPCMKLKLIQVSLDGFNIHASRPSNLQNAVSYVYLLVGLADLSDRRLFFWLVRDHLSKVSFMKQVFSDKTHS